jgi:hypothetical protein
MRHGASEFALGMIGSDPDLSAFGARFDGLMAPFALGVARRRLMTSRDGKTWDIDVPVFRLSGESIRLLTKELPNGFFTYVPDTAWYEDLTVYRDGDLMMGVITHESEGVVAIRPEESLAFDQLDIPFRFKGAWAGYPPVNSREDR